MQDCNQGSWSWSETVSYQDGYLKLLSYQTETLARIQVPICWFGEYIAKVVLYSHVDHDKTLTFHDVINSELSHFPRVY